MFQYELKKVFLKTGGGAALFLILILVGITCYFAADVYYVNENGEKEIGSGAVRELRAVQKEWAGYLDEEKIRQVIAENNRIRHSPEALSKELVKENIAYGWGQGIAEIRNLLNCSYAEGFREYDYYRADALSEDEAGWFYENRISLLKKWLEDEAEDMFSEKEKEYLIRRYDSVQTPFYYDYMKGWTQLFEYSPTVIMIVMLILGYLVAGIFSNEFAWKSDAVLFSSMYGRNKAVVSKIGAGIFIVTAVYWGAVLLYSGIVLLYLGADGLQCPVQADRSGWKCFYNITVWQKYLLIIAGGYIGCLFISFLSMLVSAKTKSTVLAVMVPFALIFIPSFLANINSASVSKILSLLPDQLLQTEMALNYFSLYTVAGKTVGAVPVLLAVYTALTVMLAPLVYWEYGRKQIG